MATSPGWKPNLFGTMQFFIKTNKIYRLVYETWYLEHTEERCFLESLAQTTFGINLASLVDDVSKISAKVWFGKKK